MLNTIEVQQWDYLERRAVGVAEVPKDVEECILASSTTAIANRQVHDCKKRLHQAGDSMVVAHVVLLLAQDAVQAGKHSFEHNDLVWTTKDVRLHHAHDLQEEELHELLGCMYTHITHNVSFQSCTSQCSKLKSNIGIIMVLSQQRQE